MQQKTDKLLVLKMPAEEGFVPLVTSYVRHAAKGLGMDRETSEKLGLAAEEVVGYLARTEAAGREITVGCKAGSHYIETTISLPVQNMHLRAFNMTATINSEDESALDQLGLLIASRMADRFCIARSAGGNLVLTLSKELQYPELETATPAKAPSAVHDFALQVPDSALIKWFVHLVHQCYSPSQYPMDFRYPGKIVDMWAAGDYQILLAVGDNGEIGGGMLWKWSGEKMVEFFGPYVFHGDSHPEMARELLDGCISKVARTSALVLICREPTAQLPEGYLERLGTLPGGDAGDGQQEQNSCFRLMHEDMGTVVWSHPDLVDFLQNEYRRLVFPRDLQQSVSEGEAQEPHSVLSVETDRRLGAATIRSLWPGKDCEENLAEHVALLRKEKLAPIFFEMDLGVAWQSGFTPGLLKLGFSPRLLLPYGGTADLVIFALEGAA